MTSLALSKARLLTSPSLSSTLLQDAGIIKEYKVGSSMV